MTAITKQSPKIPPTKKELALREALPLVPVELIRIIFDYLGTNFSNPTPKKREYKTERIGHSNCFFYGHNTATGRGEIIHYNPYRSEGGGILQVHGIDVEERDIQPRKFHHSAPAQISDWRPHVIRIQNSKSSFHFYFRDGLLRCKTFDLNLTDTIKDDSQLLVRAGPISTLTQTWEDGVQYRYLGSHDTLPYPIQVRDNFSPALFFLHRDFFFVGGIERMEESDTPVCAVYSKFNQTSPIIILKPEWKRIAYETRSGSAISLFVNDEVVAMGWTLHDNRMTCILWSMNSWERVNTIETVNFGFYSPCITIENGTLAIAAENAKFTFIEYFDFN